MARNFRRGSTRATAGGNVDAARLRRRHYVKTKRRGIGLFRSCRFPARCPDSWLRLRCAPGCPAPLSPQESRSRSQEPHRTRARLQAAFGMALTMAVSPPAAVALTAFSPVVEQTSLSTADSRSGLLPDEQRTVEIFRDNTPSVVRKSCVLERREEARPSTAASFPRQSAVS